MSDTVQEMKGIAARLDGRCREDSRPFQGIQRMNPRHFKIVELDLEGFTRTDIARLLGMTPEGVGLVQKSELYQDELARRREQQNQRKDEGVIMELGLAKETIQRASLDAAEKLVSQVHDPDPKLANKACNDLLNMAFGGEGGGGGGSRGGTTVITIEQLQLIQATLAETGYKIGGEGA